MNQKVRLFLIDQCVKNRPIYYQSVSHLLGLDFSSATQRQILSQELDEISVYEHKNGRPLLSSAAIYKQSDDHDYDQGFLRLCEKLGIGNAFELQRQFFRFTEFQACKVFWENTENYKAFASSN
jgi:hypothetical protein